MSCCPVNLILEGGGQLITCDVICSELGSPEICFFLCYYQSKWKGMTSEVIVTWKCFVYLKHAHCVQCVVLLLPIILDVEEK